MTSLFRLLGCNSLRGSIRQPRRHRPILIPKVRSLCKSTEESNLDDTRQQLDLCQQLIPHEISACCIRVSGGLTYLGGLQHHFTREWRIDDKVSVITDHRPGLCLSHPKCQDLALCSRCGGCLGGRWGSESGETTEDGDVGEGRYFDWDALGPLRGALVGVKVERARNVRFHQGLCCFFGSRLP